MVASWIGLTVSWSWPSLLTSITWHFAGKFIKKMFMLWQWIHHKKRCTCVQYTCTFICDIVCVNDMYMYMYIFLNFTSKSLKYTLTCTCTLNLNLCSNIFYSEYVLLSLVELQMLIELLPQYLLCRLISKNRFSKSFKINLDLSEIFFPE